MGGVTYRSREKLKALERWKPGAYHTTCRQFKLLETSFLGCFSTSSRQLGWSLFVQVAQLAWASSKEISLSESHLDN